MTMRLPVALLGALSLAAALPAAAQASPGFATPAGAFKAGEEICARSFEGLKASKPFGSELKAATGFESATADMAAPGVASLTPGLEHLEIVKAQLPEPGPAAVYVLSGARAGGLPSCQVVAVRALGAAAEAKTWFEDPASGWTDKVPATRDAALNLVERTFGRPFQGQIGVGATLNYVDGEPKGAITALSSFSLARDR